MASYTVERSTTVNAPVGEVHALLDDFHHWTQWSPWEDVDPDLRRTYSGPHQGVGAHYEWSGNKKAGQGSMRITGSTRESVDVDLAFLKPFKSQSKVRFDLVPRGTSTEVTWRMSGQQTGVMAVVGKVVKMDKLIGPDFEKGLARLKAVAEHTA